MVLAPGCVALEKLPDFPAPESVKQRWRLEVYFRNRLKIPQRFTSEQQLAVEGGSGGGGSGMAKALENHKPTGGRLLPSHTLKIRILKSLIPDLMATGDRRSSGHEGGALTVGLEPLLEEMSEAVSASLCLCLPVSLSVYFVSLPG